MQGIARNFLILALGYALVGMALGLSMAISQDHGQMPTHAHIMVAGWLMSSIFAFFYHLFPGIAAKNIARFHFWLTAASGIVLVSGLFMLLGGHESIEPMVGVASVCFYAAMFVFIIVALPVVRGRTA